MSHSNTKTNEQEQHLRDGDDDDDEIYCNAEDEEQSDAFTFTSTGKENLMDSTEWPSLLPGIASPNPSDTSWEMVSPSAQQQQHHHHHQTQHSSPKNRLLPASVPTLTDESTAIMIDDSVDDAVVVDLPPKLTSTIISTKQLGRQRSFSTPDFIHLEHMSGGMTTTEQQHTLQDNDDDDLFPNADDSHRTYPPQTTTSITTTNGGWNGVSFRDIVMSQVHGLAEEVGVDPLHAHEEHEPLSPMAATTTAAAFHKPRPKFVVVTPIQRQRRYESTPNLRSLVGKSTTTPSSTTLNDETLILGETDAMEFYHRKAKGFAGHKNGLRLRPDEAKRKDITMYKKELQRQTVAG